MTRSSAGLFEDFDGLILGIEYEIRLLDRRLWSDVTDTSKVQALLNEIKQLGLPLRAPLYAIKEVTPETKSSVFEVVSVPLHVASAFEFFKRIRRAGEDMAAMVNCHAGFTSMPINWPGGGIPVAEQSRYQTFEKALGATMRRNDSTGIHIHFEVSDPELRVHLRELLRPFLHLLVATSAGSPIRERRLTGYKTSRIAALKDLPTNRDLYGMTSMQEYQKAVSSTVKNSPLKDHIDHKAGMAQLNGYFHNWVRVSIDKPTVELRILEVGATPRHDLFNFVLAVGLVNTLIVRHNQGKLPVRTVAPSQLDTWFEDAQRNGLSGHLGNPLTGTHEPAGRVIAELLDFIKPGLERAEIPFEVVEDLATAVGKNQTTADLHLACLSKSLQSEKTGLTVKGEISATVACEMAKQLHDLSLGRALEGSPPAFDGVLSL